MRQMLPQRVSLSVLESVLVALKATDPLGGSGSARDSRTRAVEALRRVGLAGRAADRLDRVSGGQRQLASLAGALVRDPRLLLLDEPTSALDLRHQYAVMSLVRSFAQEGRIVIVVLHDLSLAARWSDQLVVLRDGTIRTSGPPATTLLPSVLADTWRVEADVVWTADTPLIHVSGNLEGEP